MSFTKNITFPDKPTVWNFIDLESKSFNRLIAIAYTGKNRVGHSTWLCQCECGHLITATTINLQAGGHQSCGCLSKERLATAHNRTHGRSQDSIYRIWGQMKRRCHNPHDSAYPDYGGRGITVCDRWLSSFENFLEDMGERPSKKYSLDRINNDLGYSPENCQWATKKTQANNRRSNLIISYQGKTQNATQWARDLGISAKIIMERLEHGWNTKDTLTKPLRKHINGRYIYEPLPQINPQ